MIALARQFASRYYLTQPALSQLQLIIVIIGSLFWAEAQLSGDAFSAAVFGTFALQYPAEMWAGIMMAGSAIVWIGLRHPVKWWMVSIGAGVQSLQYIALGYSAIMTGGEMVIGLHCTMLFAPIFARMFWEATFNHAD
jgi:hypothetical protein